MPVGQFPEITYRYPTLNSPDQTAVRPDIIIDWSTDIVTTEFSDAARRAAVLVLVQDEANIIVPTTFVSYDPTTRRVIVRPSEDLLPSTSYRIVVKKKIAATDGRKSVNEYNWTFLTAAAALTAPTLVSPGDFTVQPIFPALYWSNVSGTGINFELQLGDRFDFVAPAYTTTTAATAVLPSFTYDEDTTYYWRVRAYNTSATGAWSETRNFYYGRSLDADPTSRQTFPDTDFFGVQRTSFRNGATMLAAHPTLSITFTSTPASDYANYIQVISKAQLPRNDQPTSYQEATVDGSWNLTGNVLTFTPTAAISENTRYEILIDPYLTDTRGFTLNESVRFYWSGVYSPFYVSPRAVRARFLSAEQQIPDDLINFYIYEASLEANARYYGFLINSPSISMMGDSLSELLVRDSPDMKSFGVLKWVEAAATYNLLKAILFENLRNIGLTERLGDGSISLTADFVKGMEAALQKAKEDLEQWQNYLTPSDWPLTVSRSSNWSPFAYDMDFSIRHNEAKRDDGF